jgi:hypothetical protein
MKENKGTEKVSQPFSIRAHGENKREQDMFLKGA